MEICNFIESIDLNVAYYTIVQTFDYCWRNCSSYFTSIFYPKSKVEKRQIEKKNVELNDIYINDIEMSDMNKNKLKEKENKTEEKQIENIQLLLQKKDTDIDIVYKIDEKYLKNVNENEKNELDDWEINVFGDI